MESSNRSNLRTFPRTSRETLLPPIGSLTHPSLSYVDSYVLGSEAIQKPMEGKGLHQRCSSESFLLEQPSWLDDLLNEPETLEYKGHRRSASDSSTYLGPIDKAFNTNKENNVKDPVNITGPSWGSPNLVPSGDPWQSPFNKKPCSSSKQHSSVSDPSLNSMACSNGHSPARDDVTTLQTSLSLVPLKESERLSSTAPKKREQEDSGSQTREGSAERSDAPQTKPSMSKAEAKRAKQQSAHRSRVRKLQYIAELERNIQVLQTEGAEVSAELEFLDQQNLILGMENRALRQRLDSLSQEHLIKHLEQDMLEREIARLQTMYQIQMQQQQQQQQQHLQHSKHRRNKSKDLDAQFANLSI